MFLWASETERGRQSKKIIGRTPKAQTAALEVVAAVRSQGCLNVAQANACTNPQTISPALAVSSSWARREKVRSQNFNPDGIRHYLKPKSEVYARRKSATRSRIAFAAGPPPEHCPRGPPTADQIWER